MIKRIYNEKTIINKLIDRLDTNSKYKILNDRSIIFENESSDEEIYKILKKSLKDKSLDPYLVFNKLPLLNNNFIINF